MNHESSKARDDALVAIETMRAREADCGRLREMEKMGQEHVLAQQLENATLQRQLARETRQAFRRAEQEATQA